MTQADRGGVTLRPSAAPLLFGWLIYRMIQMKRKDPIRYVKRSAIRFGRNAAESDDIEILWEKDKQEPPLSAFAG